MSEQRPAAIHVSIPAWAYGNSLTLRWEPGRSETNVLRIGVEAYGADTEVASLRLGDVRRLCDELVGLLVRHDAQGASNGR